MQLIVGNFNAMEADKPVLNHHTGDTAEKGADKQHKQWQSVVPVKCCLSLRPHVHVGPAHDIHNSVGVQLPL